MKSMLQYTLFSLLALPMGACSDEEASVPMKDWDGTSTYFAPTDEASFKTYYKPAVGHVGDPMPFYDPVAEDFKILYLQDYRPNPAGTYHPIWAVSTKDAAHYMALGELISCGGIKEQDAAIGTGCTVYNPADKQYYTFYTGNKYMPTATDHGQVVMLATSSDFKAWTKNRTLYIKGVDAGYEKNDFRDPFVFADETGTWHMLVSTKKNGKGVLAEYTSSDLLNWEHAGVFMTMMWDRFYECPDVFKMGDYWYLVYSEIHSAVRKVQYFKGRTLEELKAATANDAGLWPDAHEGVLDSRGFYAGKTAGNGTDRYIWGWCATREGEDNGNAYEWAGALVAHKLIQHEDGSLTLGAIEGVDKKYTQPSEVKVMQTIGDAGQNNGQYTLSEASSLLFNRLGNHNKISFTLTAADKYARFGVSFVRGTDSDKYYSLVINPEDDGNNHKLNFEIEGEKGSGFQSGMDSYKFATPADNVYHVTIYIDNSIAVVYVNDVLAHTVRLYGIQRNCWSINSYTGTATVADLRVSTY